MDILFHAVVVKVKLRRLQAIDNIAVMVGHKNRGHQVLDVAL